MSNQITASEDPDGQEVVVPADLGFDAPEQSIIGLTAEQQEQAETFAVEFLKKVLRLRGVRIDRAQFLKAELHKRGIAPTDIQRAIAETPVAAGITAVMLDEIALASIHFETRKSSALSFAAGVPGGWAMFATVPGDVTQFYVHAFRVIQKVAYVYGWQSLLEDTDDIDDETLGRLASLLGVMMGVGAASGAVTNFAANVARPAVEKQIAKTALTKTTWYGPMKQVLRIVGVKVTKQTFAKTVAKVVPIVGGVVSGGMTMVLLDTQSKRLMQYLRRLPPPNVDAAEYLKAIDRADAEAAERTGGVSRAVGSAVSSTIDRFRAIDLDGDGLPDEPRAKTAAKGAASAVRGGVGDATRRLRRTDREDSSSKAGASHAEADAATYRGTGDRAGRRGALVRRKKAASSAEDGNGVESHQPENS